MTRRILVLDGHPDPRGEHFVHGLATAYRESAVSAGHAVRTIVIASLDFPLLRSPDEFQKGRPPASILAAQADIEWANHIAIFYPLWLGSMPALTKGFFEQALRPGFAFGPAKGRGLPQQKLKGRSARVVVTMGMPIVLLQVVLPRTLAEELRAQHPALLRHPAGAGHGGGDGGKQGDAREGARCHAPLRREGRLS